MKGAVLFYRNYACLMQQPLENTAVKDTFLAPVIRKYYIQMYHTVLLKGKQEGMI